MGVRDGDNGVVDDEADLLGDVAGWAVHDLRGEVGGKRNLLGRPERILAKVHHGIEWLYDRISLMCISKSAGSLGKSQRPKSITYWTVEKSSQVESGEGVENDDLMGGVGVDGLVEGEVGGGVVEGLVQSGHCGGEGVGETGDPLLEETLALSGGDWRTRALVVVERL